MSHPKITHAEMLRDFCARVIILAHYVQDANGLSDIQLLKDNAKAIEKEALGVSKAVWKL